METIDTLRCMDKEKLLPQNDCASRSTPCFVARAIKVTGLGCEDIILVEEERDFDLRNILQAHFQVISKSSSHEMTPQSPFPQL